MKSAWLWVADFGETVKPGMRICADLFFSSKEKFRELYTCSDAWEQQLVLVSVPDDFDWWDFIPDNY
jgi:hypothetical protein